MNEELLVIKVEEIYCAYCLLKLSNDDDLAHSACAGEILDFDRSSFKDIFMDLWINECMKNRNNYSLSLFKYKKPRFHLYTDVEFEGEGIFEWYDNRIRGIRILEKWN